MKTYSVRIYDASGRTQINATKVEAESRNHAVDSALLKLYGGGQATHQTGGHCDGWESYTPKTGHLRIWCDVDVAPEVRAYLSENGKTGGANGKGDSKRRTAAQCRRAGLASAKARKNIAPDVK